MFTDPTILRFYQLDVAALHFSKIPFLITKTNMFLFAMNDIAMLFESRWIQKIYMTLLIEFIENTWGQT